jgi:hypothetical protein
MMFLSWLEVKNRVSATSSVGPGSPETTSHLNTPARRCSSSCSCRYRSERAVALRGLSLSLISRIRPWWIDSSSSKIPPGGSQCPLSLRRIARIRWSLSMIAPATLTQCLRRGSSVDKGPPALVCGRLDKSRGERYAETDRPLKRYADLSADRSASARSDSSRRADARFAAPL